MTLCTGSSRDSARYAGSSKNPGSQGDWPTVTSTWPLITSIQQEEFEGYFASTATLRLGRCTMIRQCCVQRRPISSKAVLTWGLRLSNSFKSFENLQLLDVDSV